MYKGIVSKLVIIFVLMLGMQVSVYAADGELKKADPDFFDGLIKENMEKADIPGLTFIMTRDGEVAYKKGYGTSNLRDNTPVNPDTTIFRVGSISKLFTTAAVMQLYEQGKLDLDEDINKYLEAFKINNRFGKKITIANLLTHTAGFDERSLGLAAKDRESVIPLEKYLSEYKPQVFVEPGTVYSYSNYGMSLAGYIVEKVSGIPFGDYVEQNILKPLEMQHSSFIPPSAAIENMAQGYVYSSGVQNPIPADYFNSVPAGGLYSTASDMANFMTAILRGGSYKGHQILKKETVEEMERRHFSYRPDMPGVAYGFHERYANNQRILEHTGGWFGFTSMLFIIPDRNVGIFFSYNTGNGNDPGIINNIVKSIMDRYYPSEQNINESGEPSGTEVSALHDGTYRLLGEYSMYNVEKIISLLSQLTVTTDSKSSFVLSSAISPGSGGIRWSSSGAGLFKSNDAGYTDYKLAFSNDGRYMYLDLNTLEKLPWYESAGLHIIALAAFILVFAAGLLLWGARSIVRRLRKKIPMKRKTPEVITGVICILNLLFIVLFALILTVFQSDVLHGYKAGLTIVLSIPIITTLLALLQAVLAINYRRKGLFAGITLAYYLFFVICHLAFVPFLYYWNLIGFKF